MCAGAAWASAFCAVFSAAATQAAGGGGFRPAGGGAPFADAAGRERQGSERERELCERETPTETGERRTVQVRRVTQPVIHTESCDQ